MRCAAIDLFPLFRHDAFVKNLRPALQPFRAGQYCRWNDNRSWGYAVPGSIMTVAALGFISDISFVMAGIAVMVLKVHTESYAGCNPVSSV
jgi:hypothetical protein